MWNVVIFIVFALLFAALVDSEEEIAFGLLSFFTLTLALRMGNKLKNLNLKLFKLEQKYESLQKQKVTIESSPIKNEIQLAEIQTLEEEKEPKAEPIEEEVLSYFELKKNASTESIGQKDDEPLLLDKFMKFVVSYMKKGNPLVKVGAALLFFGLSFLIKFAAEQDMISIEIGIISSIVFSFVLIGLGWRYRLRVGSYGLVLQGLGISVLYLSIFSSAKYFEIIPFSFALALMVVVVVFASFLAVAQNSLYLALFATTGGFLSPILTSTGDGSHISLFSYYAILNIGIISIAWFKSWRILNLSGFAFTFIISLLWGAQRYTPEHLYTTEPFLIFFFLLYVAVSVIFAFKKEYKIKAYVDTSLVFGVPVTAFAMQAALVKDIEYAMSFSALILGAFYLALTSWLKKKEKMTLLAESFLALGVVFITLAIPFSLSGQWTAVTWTLEATAIIWISLRQERFYARAFALTLQLIAGFTFLEDTFLKQSDTLVFSNIFFGGFIISIAAFLSAYLFEKYHNILRSKERFLSLIFLLVGLAWWIFSGIKEIATHLEYAKAMILIFISISALVFFFIAKRFTFEGMLKSLYYFSPFGLFVMFIFSMSLKYKHPFADLGYLSFLVFFAVHYFILYTNKWKKEQYWHELGLWAIVLILSIELFYQISEFSHTLALASYPIVSILSILLLTQQRNFWPLRNEYEKYHVLGLSGIFILLNFINLILLLQDGNVLSLSYIPFLNPLDIMQISSFLVLVFWMKSLRSGLLSEKRSIYIFMGFWSIVLISVILARSIHVYNEVSYTLESMYRSEVFQAGISISYSLIALGLIILAKQKQHRQIWIIGASLLGFVTAKLFFVELSHTGTLSRIVSFMAVGILILLIAYLAPLPPKKEISS